MDTVMRAGWRNKKVSGETTLTRMWLLSAVAVVLGLVGGGAAVGLFKLISLMTHLTLLHDVGFDLPTLRDYRPDWWMVATVVAGGLVVSLFALWSPVIRGHGIPESLEAILGRDAKIRPRAAIAKPLSAAITIGTGGPFGAEGPIIVTGGSIGSLIGQLLAVSPAERKIMLATGAAAGMSATFNTPIAAVILAIELVLFERSLRAIVPLSIACGIAAAIHVVAFGSEPLFFVAAHLSVSLSHLPLFVIVGAASGVLAVVLNKGLFAMEAAFRRLPVNIFFWPAIGALGFGLIGMLVPRTLSMGYSAITDTLNGHFTVTMLAVLFVAKLLSWWIALGSQTSGGTLAPMFLVGATMGCLLGHAVDAIWPGLHASPAAFALVAMGATFGAATKALFAAVVFAIEVTGEYSMAIPLLVAAGVAELVAQPWLSDRLMTEKLSHRGFRVEFRTVVDALQMRVVRQVMREPVVVASGAPVGEAREVMLAHGLSTVAVVDEHAHYLGLLRTPEPPGAGDPAASVRALVTSAIAPLSPDEYLSSALEHFISEGVAALPVVENGCVVGQLDRADIAAERHRCSTVLETRQAGWLTGLRRARRRPARPGGTAAATGRGTDYHKIIIPAVRPDGAADRHPRVAQQQGSHDMTHRHQDGRPDGAVTGQRPGVAGARLVPLPGRVEPRLGQFTLNERSRIVVAWDSAPAGAVAEDLAAVLRPATGLRLPVSRGRAYRDDIWLHLAESEELTGRHGREQGYVLDVGMAGVTVTAPTVHGLHHGAQTIRQLLPVWIASATPVPRTWTMPSTHIVDSPRAALRSVLLDLTGALPTAATARALVDGVAAYKIDVLRVRLSAERAARLLATSGPGPAGDTAGSAAGMWTGDEFRGLVDFAAARFVAVIPEVAPGEGGAVDPVVAGRLLALAQGLAAAVGGWPREALAAAAGNPEGRLVLEPRPATDDRGDAVRDQAADWGGEAGVTWLYRAGLPGALAGAGDEVGVALPPLPRADRLFVERLLYPRLLAVAEHAWAPGGTTGPVQAFLTRLVPHGAKLALAGTGVDPEPGVPWRLDLAGVRPGVRRRSVTGRLAVVTAPGFGLEDLHVEIDWGDGQRSAAGLAAVAAREGAPASGGLFAAAGSHTYRRAGTYLVAVTATAPGTPPARTTVPVRVRGLGGGSAGLPRADRTGGAGTPGAAGRDRARAQHVGEGEPAGA